MRRGKPIEAKHLVAPFRQLVNRGASHGAETADDRVELIDHHSVLSAVMASETNRCRQVSHLLNLPPISP